MNQKTNYLHFIEARKAYARGDNVINALSVFSNIDEQDRIEIAYDLQSGSYTQLARTNVQWLKNFSGEVAKIINDNAVNYTTLLDAGCGELTSTTHIVNSLKYQPAKVWAFDLSLSRILSGTLYWAENYVGLASLFPFNAELSLIPLKTNSIDIAMTVHALEPNRNNLGPCLSEIFRVASDKIFLMEPCYERASVEAKERMDKHQYIKNLEKEVACMDGTIIDVVEIKNPSNKLNPTYCIIAEPTKKRKDSFDSDSRYSIPGTDYELIEHDEFMFSIDTGLAFPKIFGIPNLRPNNAIIASSLGAK